MKWTDTTAKALKMNQPYFGDNLEILREMNPIQSRPGVGVLSTRVSGGEICHIPSAGKAGLEYLL